MLEDNEEMMLEDNKIISLKCQKEIPQLRVFYSGNLLFKSKSEIKTFQGEKRPSLPLPSLRRQLHPAGTTEMHVGLTRVEDDLNRSETIELL